MKLFKEHPIIFIPIALLLAFLLLPLLDKNPQPKTKQAAVTPETYPSTGFPDYDLLPEKLKQRMEKVKETDSIRHYYFYYFFETDDINRHYFLDDNPMNMVFESQAVTNPEALDLVNERLAEGQSRGHSLIRHPNYWENMKDREKAMKTHYQQVISYIFPEYEADFRQLRVGIMVDTANYMEAHENEILHDTKTYNLIEVDMPPRPLRGTEYFHDAIRKYLKDQLVYFQFYDMVGTVKAEFTIGGKASSPQIIEGFSTRETERDEAYKLDGLIVKALNNLKVHWKSGQRNEKNVNTRVAMNVYFSFDEAGAMEFNFSELAPATRTF